jgi:hypothetical protein
MRRKVKIASAESLLVNLQPKVKRTDAIQSFERQETAMVKISDADGAGGVGHSSPSALAVPP